MTDNAAHNSTSQIRVYLDVCCLQRPFDDQRQARIHLEAEAVKLILARIEDGEFLWVSSEVVDDEISQNPDADRALKAQLLAKHAASALLKLKSLAPSNLSNLALRRLTLCIWHAPRAAASMFF